MGTCKSMRTSSALLLGVIVTCYATFAAAAACNSAVLQLRAFDRDPNPYASANECLPAEVVTINSLKAVCIVGLKATVDNAGIIRLAPLSTATYGYTTADGLAPALQKPCKDLNASGVFDSGSTTSATVTLFDDVGGPLSTLKKNPDRSITLTPAHIYSISGSNNPPLCAYKFTVVSGCFMGVAAKPVALSCPKNWYITTGRYSTKYCAPCKPGTSSAGGAATTCTLCPAGTANSYYGAACTTCDPGYYAAKGATACTQCSGRWTDGKTCNNCPKGSVASTTDPRQCHRCDKGKKCCTVNASPTCPPCGAGTTMPTTEYISTFALSSSSSPACQLSRAALCTPRFRLTLLPDCSLIFDNEPPGLPDRTYCQQYGQLGIKGPTASTADIGRVADLPGGKLTKVHGPFLDFYLPEDKCTLTYRALTKPAAALLGVPPRASTATASCPAGQYLEASTDTKPAPCLPCPPGSYNPKPSYKTSCTPCPAGYVQREYGKTSCSLCPSNLPIAFLGASLCEPCFPNAIRTGVNTCTDCPPGTSTPNGGDKCLGSNKGNICCSLGNCKGIPACPKTLTLNPSPNLGAIFQLVKKSLAGAACQKAKLLTCLADNAYIGLATTSQFDTGFTLTPLQQPKCSWGYSVNTGSTEFINLSGSFTSATRGAGSIYHDGPGGIGEVTGYEVQSSAAAKTIAVYLSNNFYPQNEYPPALNVTTCSATFKLVSGYAFDLTPPAGVKCPANSFAATFAGRAFCKFCSPGQFRKGSACASCPVGQYSNVYGATACKTCPAGTACNQGAAELLKCPKGTYTAAAGSQYCLKCGKNTYGNVTPGATKCNQCPARTVAPVGSSACSVPFSTSL